MEFTLFLDDELRRIISVCIEQQDRLKLLATHGKRFDAELSRLESKAQEALIREEIENVLEEIELIEARISTTNNVKNGLEQDYCAQMSANVPLFQDDEKKRVVQTKIEAQLYLNLQ